MVTLRTNITIPQLDQENILIEKKTVIHTTGKLTAHVSMFSSQRSSERISRVPLRHSLCVCINIKYIYSYQCLPTRQQLFSERVII